MARSADYVTRTSPLRSSADTPDEPGGNGNDRLTRPRGRPYDTTLDWSRVGAFALGLTMGAVVGAGAALLLAPYTGADTRAILGDRARGLRGRVGDGWDDLRAELRRAARRSRRKLRRGATRGRWKAEDLAERISD